MPHVRDTRSSRRRAVRTGGAASPFAGGACCTYAIRVAASRVAYVARTVLAQAALLIPPGDQWLLYYCLSIVNCLLGLTVDQLVKAAKKAFFWAALAGSQEAKAQRSTLKAALRGLEGPAARL